MSKKLLFYFLILFFAVLQLQAQEETIADDVTELPSDEIIKQRDFNDNLSEKYKGNEFVYTENKEKKRKKDNKKDISKRKSKPPSKQLTNFITSVSQAFPYILVLVIILIIVKAVMGEDLSWLFKSSKNKKIDRVTILSNEEESYLKNENYDKLIALAKEKGDYRTATRYYYLLLLKRMAKKGLITFDKDKTNTEYIFDLQQKELRKPFSYLLYIYDYVWYGEFVLDQGNFSVIENNYESFLKKL